jgi:HAD superfamily hydrolase (TIGR01549 family)
MRRRARPRFRAVLFDLGGTLIDNYDFPAWTDIARQLGVDVEVESLARAFREVQIEDPVDPVPSLSQWWATTLEKATGQNIRLSLAERFTERISDLPPRIRLYSDTQRCLTTLKREGRKLGVISNSKSQSHVEELLGEVGLLGYFSTVVSSGTEGVAKPDPVIFQRATERIGVGLEEAFYVGDLPNTDARAARIAGLSSVWLHRDGTGFGDNPPEITSLTELPPYLKRVVEEGPRLLTTTPSGSVTWTQ